ncbi:odorant receptor 2a [Cephus cinctus]|uniref:Odorant receptor 2a n=1 Tax=Cephus cinctus TaxID=211228 RepID=A0AAJ7FTI1_CEPCN|nr:odorant receptor 2a [Cephus cinctus]
MYEFLIVFVLFSHCVVGQYLYLESVNIHDAFYNCKWYDMSREDKTIIKFCIARSQQPLCLTAGQFGTFSLEMLTNVLKTSMAYLSLGQLVFGIYVPN